MFKLHKNFWDRFGNSHSGSYFRPYAHALRFAVGLHGTQKFHPIVKKKHCQISSEARASHQLPISNTNVHVKNSGAS